MSAVDQLMHDHFASIGAGVDPSLGIAELDIGLFQVGKVAELIIDHCTKQTDDVDAETIAAAAKAMLALLGQLGGLVDALTKFVASQPDRALVARNEVN